MKPYGCGTWRPRKTTAKRNREHPPARVRSPVSKKRQFVLMATLTSPGGGMAALGNAAAVKDILANYNTAPDGGPRKSLGTEMLHGPGMVMDIPTSSESIAQVMVSVTDEEIAWPVLSRLCKEREWKLVDLESGRTFG